jgi:malate synthase
VTPRTWLCHGLVTEQRVRETFARMAAPVDEQNAREPGYQFQAALELVFSGQQKPNGYTERALTRWRREAKSIDDRSGGDGSRTRVAVVANEPPSPTV